MADHESYCDLAPNIVSVADKNAIREILVTADYPKSEIHEGLELYNQHNLFSSRNKDFHKNRVPLRLPIDVQVPRLAFIYSS